MLLLAEWYQTWQKRRIYSYEKHWNECWLILAPRALPRYGKLSTENNLTSPRGHALLTAPAVGARFQDFPMFGPVSKHSSAHTQQQLSSPDCSSTLQTHRFYKSRVQLLEHTETLVQAPCSFLWRWKQLGQAARLLSGWLQAVVWAILAWTRYTQAIVDGTWEGTSSCSTAEHNCFNKVVQEAYGKSRDSHTNPAVLTRTLPFLLRDIIFFFFGMRCLVLSCIL